jgi:hypothetical protein
VSFRIPFLIAFGVSLLGCGAAARAQVVPAASHGAEVVTNNDSSAPDPVHVGWSATIGTTASHDSLAGWSLLETPSVAYRLNSVISMDAATPFYTYVNAVRTGKDGDPKLVSHEGIWGDTGLSGHFEFSPNPFDYLGTIAFSAPTGDEHLGTGTGHLGYDLNNHFERSMGIFTPDIEVGIGNTSSLMRPKVAKAYTSYGLLAFFQAGTAVDLPDSFNLDAEGYEQLPISSQTVYSRANRKHGAVLTNTSDAEDNGLTVELDAPPTHRFLLSASVARSVRLDDTTASVSLAFLLHVPAH